MRITFDAVKREKTPRERGLDFALARIVFDGLTITLPDQRQDYGEPRFITAGWLDERLVVLVWTPRGRARRIISMRKENEREIDKYKQSLG
ncbi:BrnT family toxin [Janthinobacterium lividum]|uniref:BrnT family toxin n=1 Tax=Janthinobacterium lividum TaxID=29581 RepID=UPI001594F4BF|nr:BrnT family toxin [Janthinobacterium lividum]QKY07936.1 BrnT family toxin [Janthinobacterium lividum]